MPPDLYAVFGNPIAHSKSPAIHAAFAAQTGDALVYEARLAPLDDFASAVQTLRAEGGRGANVTVPFKETAFQCCDGLSPQARLAGAVNTLIFSGDRIEGHNTDGIGLVRDLTQNLGRSLAGQRILLLGAGGAARGAMAPLLDAQPRQLCVTNRTVARAEALVLAFADHGPVMVSELAALQGAEFDVVINATAASLAGQPLGIPAGLFAPDALAYDMMYARGATPFLQEARQAGAAHVADGLGMLVEQAAEAFWLWRGRRPETTPVLAQLRRSL